MDLYPEKIKIHEVSAHGFFLIYLTFQNFSFFLFWGIGGGTLKTNRQVQI